MGHCCNNRESLLRILELYENKQKAIQLMLQSGMVQSSSNTASVRAYRVSREIQTVSKISS